MDDRSKPPWSQERIDALNQLQESGIVHPYTCGGNRHDEAHKAYQAEHGGDLGQLVATEEGWVCPVLGCEYTQPWAYNFTVDFAKLTKGKQ